jgi:ABC-type transporter Mla MlaB component
MKVATGAALTLATVADVKQALCAALAAGGAVPIDASNLAELDLAGLQLLCAAQRGAAQQGRALSITGAAADRAAGAATDRATGLATSLPVVARAIADVGFGRDATCVDSCLCKEATRG